MYKEPSVIVVLFLTVAFAFTYAAGVAAAAEPNARLPNIVVILADDLGYGDIGCYNPKSKIPTPHVDRLAGEGMRFTDAHTAAAVCTPSRYALLTGRYCWRSRWKKNGLGDFGQTLIEPNRLTLPAMLKQKGYATAAIGKWHLGWQWPTTDGAKANHRANQFHSNVDFTKPLAEGPVTRGFDYYFGSDVPNYPPHCFIENDRTVGLPTQTMPHELIHGPPPKGYGEMGLREGPMVSGWDVAQILPAITGKATQYIRSQAKDHPSRPFFLYLALTGPHAPITPTREFQGKSGIGPYGDFTCQVDASVGDVLAALNDSGLAENTLVIFTSDNGPENIAYALAEQSGHFSMGDLRGIKRDTWEGGHRVPFIARWPGRIKAGTASNQLLCLIDLMSTFAAIAGAAVPNDAAEDSFNLLPALTGEQLEQPIRGTMIHHSAAGQFAIRQGDWVLIDAPSGEDRDEETEWFKLTRGYVPGKHEGQLFNLREDPTQRDNRFADEPQRVAEFRTLLTAQQAAGRTRPR